MKQITDHFIHCSAEKIKTGIQTDATFRLSYNTLNCLIAKMYNTNKPNLTCLNDGINWKVITS